MRARRIVRLKKQGFEVVDSLPTVLALPEGDTTPFRQTAAPVVAHYARTTRERWLVAANFAIGGTRPSELLLTATHLYGRFMGVGGDVLARIPRAALRVRWRYGAMVLYGLADGSRLALAKRDGDGLLAALDAEIVSRPDAPFRAIGTLYQGGFPAAVVPVVTAVSLGQGVSWSAAGVLALGSLLASWVFHNRVEVTAEGLTVEVGVFPTWTRFVPRERIHSVVLREDKRPLATLVSIEIEVWDAKNVPTNYVIARGRTTHPAREYIEREFAPEARRVAALLGCRGPRWDT